MEAGLERTRRRRSNLQEALVYIDAPVVHGAAVGLVRVIGDHLPGRARFSLAQPANALSNYVFVVYAFVLLSLFLGDVRRVRTAKPTV